MENKKRTILICVLVGLLVVALAVGATFAFFTDSVVSQENKVKAGTLKVDLELLKNGRYTSIKNDPQAIFNYELWEPGFTDVKLMRVVNNGSLALKWEAKLTTTGTLNALADEIKVYVLNDGATAIDAPANLAAVTGNWTEAGTLTEFFTNASTLLKGTLVAAPNANSPQYAYIAIALHMPTTVGNTNAEGVELQDLALPAFDIQILATQLTYESDAFDDQYDVNACNHANTAVIPGTPATYEATGLTDGVKCATCEKVLIEQEEISMLVSPYLAFVEIKDSSGEVIAYSAKFSGEYPDSSSHVDIVIPNSYLEKPVISIEESGFNLFLHLGSVTIPYSVTTIGSKAFRKCMGMSSINFTGTMEQWNAISFGSEWNGAVPATQVSCSDGTVTLGN